MFQVMLIKKLKELLNNFDAVQKKAQNEELKKQRLERLEYINVSLGNMIQPEEKEKKKKKRKYREHEDSGSESTVSKFF